MFMEMKENRNTPNINVSAKKRKTLTIITYCCLGVVNYSLISLFAARHRKDPHDKKGAIYVQEFL